MSDESHSPMDRILASGIEPASFDWTVETLDGSGAWHRAHREGAERFAYFLAATWSDPLHVFANGIYRFTVMPDGRQVNVPEAIREAVLRASYRRSTQAASQAPRSR